MAGEYGRVVALRQPSRGDDPRRQEWDSVLVRQAPATQIRAVQRTLSSTWLRGAGLLVMHSGTTTSKLTMAHNQKPVQKSLGDTRDPGTIAALETSGGRSKPDCVAAILAIKGPPWQTLLPPRIAAHRMSLDS